MSDLGTGIAWWSIGQQGPQPAKLRLDGKDNSGKPRQDYADKLADMDDRKLVDECESYVWLSAYAANNLRSDYHWMCDATSDEAQRRGKPELYQRGWERASGNG